MNNIMIITTDANTRLPMNFDMLSGVDELLFIINSALNRLYIMKKISAMTITFINISFSFTVSSLELNVTG